MIALKSGEDHSTDADRISTIAVLIDSPAWEEACSDLPIHIDQLARMVLAILSPSLEAAEISVLLTDDAAVKDLNRAWRGQDKPTNVLSFPAQDVPAGSIPEAEFAGIPLHLGDLALAWQTMTAEAEAAHIPFLHHMDHLIIHGILHLVGYDHQSDTEAEQMEELERRILAMRGIRDPYADSGNTGTGLAAPVDMPGEADAGGAQPRHE